MKKLTAIAISTALIAITHSANAADSGPYIQADVYGTDLTDTRLTDNFGGSAKYDSDIGLGAGGEVGYKFNKYLRTDLEATYRHNDVSSGAAKGEFNSGALLANMYIDIPTNTVITPYVGAGAGYAHVTDTHYDDNVFAYQGMAGLSFAASDKADIVLGYKFLNTSTPKYDLGFGEKVSAPYKVHNVELGFRYKF